jgi:hypothetical protein
LAGGEIPPAVSDGPLGQQSILLPAPEARPGVASFAVSERVPTAYQLGIDPIVYKAHVRGASGGKHSDPDKLTDQQLLKLKASLGIGLEK